MARLVFFAVQLALVLLVSLHDTFSTFSRSRTVFPAALQPAWGGAADIVALPLGLRLPAGHPLRQALSGYLNVTGIEAGYSYFAPGVPDNYKIVFLLRFPDGHTEDDLPTVSGRATGLRLATLLDEMAETNYEPLRAMMVKMMAYAAWHQHPEATSIRAVFGYVDLPTMAEFRRGQTESYHVLFAYDFDFTPAQSRGR
jgi:hypothetical protein